MRWTQQDPQESPGDVQSLNRFAYSGGNPINAIDPMGDRYYNNDSEGYCATYGHYAGCASGYPPPRGGSVNVLQTVCYGKLGKSALSTVRRIAGRAALATNPYADAACIGYTVYGLLK